MPYFDNRSGKRPRPTTDSGVGDHCVDRVRNPTERKYAKEPEMASDEKLRYTILPPKNIKMDAILSGLSHWELEGKTG
jgi:hypothetical protein